MYSYYLLNCNSIYVSAQKNQQKLKIKLVVNTKSRIFNGQKRKCLLWHLAK